MLEVKDRGILIQIKKRILRIENKIKNITLLDLKENEDLQEIICFNLAQIGESVKKLSDSFINTYTKIPWKYIKGLRNIIVHVYDTIDIELIWNTITTDLLTLKTYIQEVEQIQ